MTKYALLDSNNCVKNIFVADSIEEASVVGVSVEITEDNMSGLDFEAVYDYETNTFSPRVIE